MPKRTTLSTRRGNTLQHTILGSNFRLHKKGLHAICALHHQYCNFNQYGQHNDWIICFRVQYGVERLYSLESQLEGEHQRLVYVQKCLLSCRKPQFFIIVVVVVCFFWKFL